MTFELNAPAGDLGSLKAAVDNGADSVYFGFKSVSNLRNYPGLNLTDEQVIEGIDYLHQHGVRAYVTVNIFPYKQQQQDCLLAIDKAREFGADAVILADIGLMDYAKKEHPSLNIYASVLAKTYNSEAAKFYKELGASRIVLPCLLNLDEAAQIKETGIEVELFAGGRVIGINREGCLLNSYLAGWPISTKGACAPVEYLEQDEDLIKLKGITIGRVTGDEPTPYPAICMGEYRNLTTNSTYRVLRDGASLSVLDILPELARIGVDALKIEGRQRSKIYVGKMVSVFRQAIDSFERDPERYRIKESWRKELLSLSEGGRVVNGYVNKGY
ncbi:U32 family peptidase [bacterium]|nr:U32 family peptidase [bacterium]